MSVFIAEMIGTALLFILGGGVVANVVLDKTKGNSSGWIVITFGWAMAVFIGVYASSALGSGGHINSAVTIALIAIGKTGSELLVPYIGGQFTGAFIGAIVVWLAYKQHFDASNDANLKLAVFSTAPAIRNPLYNVITEAVGTFVLMFGGLAIMPSASSLGALDALPVALLVLGIGLSLGGPTGYAINPARDLAPRIAHSILPIKGKRDSDWSYSWVPVVGPIIGAVLGAVLYNQLIL